ncbi:MAG: hypothetical protein EXR58_05785 [Chloroflexi bacterium]|nr:hypothetical protein [Chloroflexota bacterium]
MYLGSLTIDDFLDRLGSADPTPGGGALAALAGAQAAAMLAMVCNLTIGRPRFADVETAVRAQLQRCIELRQQLMHLADADAAAYGSVRDAYRLPRSTDEDRSARAAAIEAAMQQATDVPAQTAEAARAVLTVGLAVAELGNPSVLPDVSVATHVATAALRGGAIQAEYNLPSLKTEDFANRMRRRVEAATSGVDSLGADILATVRRRSASV